MCVSELVSGKGKNVAITPFWNAAAEFVTDAVDGVYVQKCPYTVPANNPYFMYDLEMITTIHSISVWPDQQHRE